MTPMTGGMFRAGLSPEWQAHGAPGLHGGATSVESASPGRGAVSQEAGRAWEGRGAAANQR
eukprot:2346452-Pyramimonas_sp.AAC.1